jgi:hypothetical protein
MGDPFLQGPERTAIRAGPGDSITGHSPGVFLKAGQTDLKPAGTDPAEFLPFPAAVALKSPWGSFGFFPFMGHRQLKIFFLLTGEDNQGLSRADLFVFDFFIPLKQIIGGDFILRGNTLQGLPFFHLMLDLFSFHGSRGRLLFHRCPRFDFIRR